MELALLRNTSGRDFTTGRLYVNGVFECYTLEDEKRNIKVHGETRIDDGTYEIKLRKEGGMHVAYLKKFGETFHLGMLELQSVKNFLYVYFHIGNDDDDTDGCILVGRTVDHTKGFVGESEKAYRVLYAKVAEALLCGERVFVTIRS